MSLKKYNAAYIVCAIGAALCFFWSALSLFELIRLPLRTRLGLSKTVASGGARDAYSIIMAIVMPLLCATLLVLMAYFYKKALGTDGLCRTLESKKQEFSLLHLFLLITVIWAVISIAFLSAHRETAWSHLLAIRGYDGYMDFFNHIT